LPPDYFGQVSLREYDLIIRGTIKGKDAEFEARRVLNQEAGILAQFAFHDPKNMPDFTKALAKKPSPKSDSSHGVETLRACLIGMHSQG
jgi:hypothetical protein